MKPTPRPAPAPRSRQAETRRRRFIGIAVSLAAHGLILGAVLSVRSAIPPDIQAEPVTVSLVRPLPPAPQPAPTPAKARSPKPAAKPAAKAPPRQVVQTIAMRHSPRPATTGLVAAADSGSAVSDADLAGAASAGSGGGGGGSCDMAARVQAALRKDPLVRDAVTSTNGKAVMVWNGDWVRSGAEDGKGLAAVREAILWEVGFAPPACRSQPMHGLVLLTLPGSARLVVGEGQWRWSDMLGTGRR